MEENCLYLLRQIKNLKSILSNNKDKDKSSLSKKTYDWQHPDKCYEIVLQMAMK